MNLFPPDAETLKDFQSSLGDKCICGPTGEISGEGGRLREMSSHMVPMLFASFRNTFFI